MSSNLDEQGVRTILLNRPAQLNAMNRSLIGDVLQAFDDANADSATRVIVFSGAGRAFCAGDDRNEHQHPASEAEARVLNQTAAVDLEKAMQLETEATVAGFMDPETTARLKDF